MQDRVAATTNDGGIVLVVLGRGVTQVDGAGSSPDGIAPFSTGGFVVSNTAAAFSLFDVTGARLSKISSDTVNATLSASSLSAHPDGRWLAASRDDGVIGLYSLDQPTEAIDLPILRQDSKVVAFSPDGANLAALDAGYNLYVWRFDTDQGAAARNLQLAAPPRRGGPEGYAREVSGLGQIALLSPRCAGGSFRYAMT